MFIGSETATCGQGVGPSAVDRYFGGPFGGPLLGQRSRHRGARNVYFLRDEPNTVAGAGELARTNEISTYHPPRPPDPLALLSSSLLSRLRSDDDSIALNLRNPSEHGDEELAHRAAHRKPLFPCAHHLDAAAIELANRIENADHRAAQSIERPNEEHLIVARVRSLQHAIELGTFLRRRADSLVVNHPDFEPPRL